MKSLRQKGKFKGKIVICDNVINNNKIVKNGTFSADQLHSLRKYKVEIVTFNELLISNNIRYKKITRIRARNDITTAQLLKFVYCTLISKKYLGKVNRIFFSDSDIYFQDKIDKIFHNVKKPLIYFILERRNIRKDKWIQNSIFYSDFWPLTNFDRYQKTILKGNNICTGFFGSKADVFNKFCLLAWLIASNNILKFHCDQPLANIMVNFFNISYEVIANDLIFNFSGSKQGNYVSFEKKKMQFKVDDKVYPAVHFNGREGSKLFQVLMGKIDMDEYYNFIKSV